MITTFTPQFDLSTASPESQKESPHTEREGPSDLAIRNVLDFSRNLEVKPSSYLKTVDYIRS